MAFYSKSFSGMKMLAKTPTRMNKRFLFILFLEQLCQLFEFQNEMMTCFSGKTIVYYFIDMPCFHEY
jgi:hypothetical protein